MKHYNDKDANFNVFNMSIENIDIEEPVHMIEVILSLRSGKFKNS